jgi:ABC-2 type transport system permease protein
VYLAAGRPSQAVVPWLAIVSSAAFAYGLGDLIARIGYRWTWSVAAGGGVRRRARVSILIRAIEWVGGIGGRVPALFISKDVRAFVRDPSQWAQFVIFFGLLGIYIANLRNLHYDYTRGFWLFLVSTLNFGATALTLATLTTRFIFPQVSLEGRRFWVLGLAPIRRRHILYGKFAFALLGAFLVSEVLVVLSSFMLRMPREVFITHSIAIGFVCIGLTGLAVGLGAVFPSYGESNPSRIVSGFGGTLTLIISVVYVVAMVALVAVPSQLRLVRATLGPRGFADLSVLVTLLAAATTGAAAGIPLWLGARALDRAEF